jgi:ribosome assembly protein YihI (activator of Der GTPase)
LLEQLVGKTTNSKKTRKTKPPGSEEIDFHKTRSNKNQELQQTISKKTRKTKPPGSEEINFHKTRSNKNQELQQTIIK